MKNVTALVVFGVALSQVGCKSDNQQREREQAQQARAEADEKAYAIARETDHKTLLINEEIARKEAAVQQQTGEAKAKAQSELDALKRSAEEDKKKLIADASKRIEEGQHSAESEEKEAYSASTEARLAFQQSATRQFEALEQRAAALKDQVKPKGQEDPTLDGVITQSRQARQNLSQLKTGDAATFRSNRATFEKQISNLKATLDRIDERF